MATSGHCTGLRRPSVASFRSRWNGLLQPDVPTFCTRSDHINFEVSVKVARFTLILLLAACGRDRASCATCDTATIAAIGEPGSILPPLVQESVGRDIGDQVF